MQTTDRYWVEQFRRRMGAFGEAPTADVVPVSVKVCVSSGCFHREHSPEAYRLIVRYLSDSPDLRREDGSVYDGTGMTAAANSVVVLKLGTTVTVTGTYRGVTRAITVVVNDRMPTGSLEKGAVIDLSPAAFNALFEPGPATPRGPGRVEVVVSFPNGLPTDVTYDLEILLSRLNPPVRPKRRGRVAADD